MNGILGMAELLRRSEVTEKQRHQLETIIKSGRALLSIINDILDYSKIESGKIELECNPFDLKACLGDVVELLQPIARSKMLKVNLELDESLPSHYIGDAGRLRQIVMNLAGNAVKFVHEGSVTVRLTGIASGDMARLRVDVVDTGIGIPPDKLKAVFEKFSQVDNTQTRQFEGTGLGLTISLRLAQLMGGDISVASEVGRGSTFTFTVELPIHQLTKIKTNDIDLSGKSYAFLDLQTAALNYHQHLLQSGLELVAHPSLEHLLATGEQREAPIAGVILRDLVLSVEILEATAAVRKHIGEQTPVIALIENGARGDSKCARDSGISAYLSGEPDLAAVLETLKQIEARRAGATAQSSANDRGELITRHSVASGTAPLARSARPDPQPSADLTSQSRKVLIVDDSIVNQEVAKEFLLEFGCEVSVAGNGVEAVELSASERFDLILMDCQMPVMDGFSATRAIRERNTGATRRQVPIVALTANAYESDREKCLGSGMSDFLKKPFLPAEIEGMVEKWLAAELVEA